jgi:hypothetical protein
MFYVMSRDIYPKKAIARAYPKIAIFCLHDVRHTGKKDSILNAPGGVTILGNELVGIERRTALRLHHNNEQRSCDDYPALQRPR